MNAQGMVVEVLCIKGCGKVVYRGDECVGFYEMQGGVSRDRYSRVDSIDYRLLYHAEGVLKTRLCACVFGFVFSSFKARTVHM